MEHARDTNVIELAGYRDETVTPVIRKSGRRRGKRINLSKAKACIQRPGHEQEIADVVNVSVSGALLICSAVFSVGEWVRVAVPYTIGGSNIFQPARIVRIDRSDTVLGYGIEYV